MISLLSKKSFLSVLCLSYDYGNVVTGPTSTAMHLFNYSCLKTASRFKCLMQQNKAVEKGEHYEHLSLQVGGIFWCQWSFKNSWSYCKGNKENETGWLETDDLQQIIYFKNNLKFVSKHKHLRTVQSIIQYTNKCNVIITMLDVGRKKGNKGTISIIKGRVC